jgi:hypothetical protein
MYQHIITIVIIIISSSSSANAAGPAIKPDLRVERLKPEDLVKVVSSRALQRILEHLDLHRRWMRVGRGRAQHITFCSTES